MIAVGCARTEIASHVPTALVRNIVLGEFDVGVVTPFARNEVYDESN